METSFGYLFPHPYTAFAELKEPMVIDATGSLETLRQYCAGWSALLAHAQATHGYDNCPPHTLEYATQLLSELLQSYLMLARHWRVVARLAL